MSTTTTLRVTGVVDGRTVSRHVAVLTVGRMQPMALSSVFVVLYLPGYFDGTGARCGSRSGKPGCCADDELPLHG